MNEKKNKFSKKDSDGFQDKTKLVAHKSSGFDS